MKNINSQGEATKKRSAFHQKQIFQYLKVPFFNL